VEIAIVLFIIGIITAALLSGAGAFRETAKFKEDQQKLQDIKTALLGFVAVNGYLPCPDTNGNGQENRTAARCTDTTGLLPHLDLNTHATNAYGYPFSYYANQNSDNASHITNKGNSASYFGNSCTGTCFNAATPPVAGQANADLGNYRVSDGTDSLANQVPLVVISHGKDLKNLDTCNGNGNFENWNCDRTQTADNQVLLYQAPQSETFDDVLIWLSSLDIKKATPGVLSADLPNPGQTPTQTPFIPFTPPEDINTVVFDQEVGDVNNSNQVTTTNQAEKIKVNGDINAALNLLNGEDALYVTGNINAAISGGNQNKTIYVEGDLNQPLSLGNGDNSIEIKGNVNATITSGNGADSVIIHGDTNQTINLDTAGQDNQIYLGGAINATVTGRGTAYINQTPTGLENWQYSYINFSTVLCRESVGSTNWVNCR
jgi:type II secretory pathway pseudopilin PulG